MHPSPEKQLTWGSSGGSGYLKLRDIGETNLLNPETQVHMCWVSKCWRSGTLYPRSSITAKFWEGFVSQATNISYHWSGCWFSNNELLEIVSAVIPMWAGSMCYHGNWKVESAVVGVMMGWSTWWFELKCWIMSWSLFLIGAPFGTRKITIPVLRRTIVNFLVARPGLLHYCLQIQSL